MKKTMINSRFATQKEACSKQFMKINHKLDVLSVKYGLPDHSDVNKERYPWSDGMLSRPEFYAARLWEYPFAILSAELQPKMRCIDVGCGMNPFIVYLKNHAQCNTVGIDPDLFGKGLKFKCHGVNQKFIKKTGLKIIEAGMEKIPFPNKSFDRVFCISVIEHVDKETALRGIREMTRILKPRGRLIITVDVNMLTELNQPLNLIWESGLIPMDSINLKWPYQRFGNFCDKLQPADVFGIVLYKDPYIIRTQYKTRRGKSEDSAWKIPQLRDNFTQKLTKKQADSENKNEKRETKQEIEPFPESLVDLLVKLKAKITSLLNKILKNYY